MNIIIMVNEKKIYKIQHHIHGQHPHKHNTHMNIKHDNSPANIILTTNIVVGEIKFQAIKINIKKQKHQANSNVIITMTRRQINIQGHRKCTNSKRKLKKVTSALL